MVDVARPAFLWAGLLLAMVPLGLHFLRPRERAQRVLPTARFLTEDSRTRIRLERRPDELLLLALRMGLCLALGAAFAGPSWVGASGGTGLLVVVDGSAAMEPFWNEIREAGAAELPEAPRSLVIVRPAPDGPPEVERIEASALHDEDAWDALRPGAGSGREDVRLAHLLRALRDEAGRATGSDSLAARIVSVPRWSAWSPGVAQLREELWPGEIDLRVPTPSGAAAPEPVERTPGPGPSVRVRAPEGILGPVLEALTTLELEAATDDPDAAEAAPELLLAVGPTELPADTWVSEPTRSSAPVGDTAEGRPDAPGSSFLLLDGRRVPGAGPVPGGTPAPGAAVPMLRAGGRPAAGASRPEGGGCRLALPLDTRAPILESRELVLVLESLLFEGCGLRWGIGGADGSGRWEDGEGGGRGADRAGALSAWRALLSGNERPRVLEAAPLRYPGAGIPLTRILLAVALGLAFLELVRVRHVDRTRRAPVTRTGEEAGRSDER